MAADLVGERFERGAESGVLVGETGDGAAVGGAMGACVDAARMAGRAHSTDSSHLSARRVLHGAEPTGTAMSAMTNRRGVHREGGGQPTAVPSCRCCR